MAFPRAPSLSFLYRTHTLQPRKVISNPDPIHRTAMGNWIQQDEAIEHFHRLKYAKSDPSMLALTSTERLAKDEAAFRDYEEASETVKALYQENHAKQTLAFVLQQKARYSPCKRMTMTVWEAMEWLDSIHDDSDPDTDASQIQHGLQSAEAARKAGHPRWFQLTTLIHDLGKVLLEFGEPQWAVVGDTFPVGCGFSERIVLPDFFAQNADASNPAYNSRFGIYKPNCGLDQVHMSYGHDEYLYHVVKDYLPEEAAYIIRYHSFYAAHRENAYDHLYDAKDRAMMPWVKTFNRFDLYTKSDDPVDVEAVIPYYRDLVREFFPEPIAW